jgi:hypothetical protein
LPGKDSGHTGTQINRKELYKCAVEMGSDAMIYVLSFIRIDIGIQKLIGRWGEIHRHINIMAIS